MRRAGLERAPCILVDGGHAQIYGAARYARQFRQELGVANDHRSFSDDANGCAPRDQGFEEPPLELVMPFDRLIRIRWRPECDLFTHPRRLVELAPEHLREIHLHEDERREVVARSELELRLVPPRKAVVTPMRAAAIRVQRPVERHALDWIERRPAGDFLVARFVRTPLRLVERLGPVLADLQRYRPGSRWFTAEIEESVHVGFRPIFAIV